MRTLLVLIALFNVAAAPATLPSFPRIELTGKAIPPAQLFDEISKDTGVNFTVNDPNIWTGENRPASVDVDINAPFWPAVQQACSLCNVTINESSDGSMTLVASSGGVWGRKPAFSSGVATFVINSIVKTSEVKLHRPEARHNRHSVSMHMLIDPRLRFGSAGDPLKVIEATDDRGPPIMFVETRVNTGSTRGWKTSSSLSFVTPEGATRIAVLKGEATLLIDEKTHNWEFPDIAAFKPATRNIDGFDVTIDVTQHASSVMVSLVVRPEKGDVQNFRAYYPKLADWAERIQLMDAAGKRYRSGGGSASYGDKVIKISRQYQIVGAKQSTPPVKLIWPVPVTTRPMVLAFEFKDLPLP